MKRALRILRRARKRITSYVQNSFFLEFKRYVPRPEESAIGINNATLAARTVFIREIIGLPERNLSRAQYIVCSEWSARVTKLRQDCPEIARAMSRSIARK